MAQRISCASSSKMTLLMYTVKKRTLNNSDATKADVRPSNFSKDSIVQNTSKQKTKQ